MPDISHPRVLGLLGSLLDLDEKDALIPLPLLISMHRAALRAPMEGLVALTPVALRVPAAAFKFERVKSVEEALAERFPRLAAKDQAVA